MLTLTPILCCAHAATLAYVLLERDLLARHGTRVQAQRAMCDSDRLALAKAAHDLGWDRVAKYAVLVSVDTLKRWWKRLVAGIQDKPRTRGRPPIDKATVNLILELATKGGYANDPWGRRRIVGELGAQGIAVSASNVKRILERHGIPPAPKRELTQPHRQWTADFKHETAATDFLVTTVTDQATGIRTLMFILVFIHLESRRVHLAGVTDHPNEHWMMQIARNLTMDGTGWLHRVGACRLIHDRDTIFTDSFREILRLGGVATTRTPPHCPWENGFVERMNRTLRHDLLDHVVAISDNALRELLSRYEGYYLAHRPHQGIGNHLIEPPTGPPGKGPVVIREDLGGILRWTEREKVA